MACMTPCQTAMDLLARWQHVPDRLSTTEVIKLSGIPYYSAPYRWMMKLATHGYFRREIAPQPRGGKLIYWTITDKGREAVIELQRIRA